MANNENKLISLRGLEEFRKLSQWTLSKNGTKVVLTGPKGETSSADVGDVNLDKINANADAIEDITDRVEELENSSITSEDIAGLAPAFTESSTLTNISSGDSFSTLFGKIRKAITDFMAHITNFANPHQVTKSQVGLGNVDNTSDVDKPISTATQEALNGKVSKLKAETLVYDLTAPNFIGHLTGAADRLANARTISLSGDASGSASFDGSQNIDITTTVADASGVTAGKMYLYQGLGQNTNGTITQKLFTDLSTAVDDVQTSADGKSTIYYRTTAPVASDDVVLKENDLWFDTDDGNKPYRWSGTAWVEAPFGDAAIANLDAGKITAGYISASRIAANTIASTHIATGAISADKIDTGAVTADKIGANAVTANKIDTGAVTADKISVDDLSALNATIGGFSISDSAIYSANKTSFSDSDSGVYFGSDGTINIGDSSQYIKFSNDGLQIRADSLSVSGSSVATTADLDDAVKTVVVEYVSSDSPVTPPTTGWSATNPNWEEGKYVWQRTITTYINDTSAISDPICIQGARGMGVVSQVPHYLASDKSEGVTSADSGWSKTVPTLTNEKKYLWMYYTNMLSSQTEPETVTVTGNPVEFESRGNNPITGSIHLVPIQNNSYDYAWTGGEGKNLIDDSKRVMNSSNTTITLGQTVGFGTTTISLKAGTYTFSVVFKDGVSAHGYMKSTYSELNSKRIWQIGDNHATFTLAEDADCSFYVYNSNGLTVNDVISAQLEIGSEVTDYEPYSNERPITSYSTASVKHFGKNILDANVALRDNSNGLTFQRSESDPNIIYATGKATGTWSSIFAEPINVGFRGGEKYTFSIGINTPISIYARVRNTDGTTNARIISVGSDHITWTQEKDGDAITEIVFQGITVGSTINDLPVKLMISSGEDTDYEKPYGVTYDITLPTNTYCSDVTLNDSGAVTFSNHGEMATFDGTANVTTSSVSGVFKLPLSHVPETVGFRDDSFDLYCDKLKPVSRYELHNGAHGIAYDGEGNYLQFRAGNATTVAEAKTWLTSNPITVVYRKAISETSALPSMDISAFTGKNMFYSHDNANATITVSYKDCETITTDAYITGVYGDKGEDGVTPVISATKDNGVTVITSNGISIAQINDGVDGENGSSFVDQIAYYLASDKSTGVTVDDEGWSRTVPELTNENKYLWIYYTNRYNPSGTEPKLVTKTGEIITTESLGENPINLSMDLEPKQDLNGYDHPWVGGSGKNLLPNTATTQTISGVTFTVNADGSITANGTASARIDFVIGTMAVGTIVQGTQYCINGCVGGSSTTYAFWLRGHGTVQTELSYDGDGIFTGNATDASTNRDAVITIFNGTSVNTIFYPMLRLASETDDTYEPYENICPITGYDGVEITRTGESVLGDITFSTGYYNDNGGNSSNTSMKRCDNYIPCEGGVSYAVLFTYGDTDYAARVRIHEYDANKTWLRQIVKTDPFDITDEINTTIWTASSDAAYFRFSLPIFDIVDAKQKATSYSITFPSSVGTVYGGNLTIEENGTGTLIVDRGCFTADEFSSHAKGSATSFDEFFFRPQSSQTPAVTTAANTDMICSHAVRGSVVGVDYTQYRMTSGQPRIIFPLGTMPTLADFNDWLAEQVVAGTPLQFSYILASPIAYTLTGTQVIKLLKGQNNIWTNINEPIDVEYTDCETSNTEAYVTGAYGDRGNTPIITSSKSNGVTIIKSDGLSVAEINDGERGTSIIKITTAPESYTTTTGGFTPTYRVAISAVLNAGVSEAKVGDILENSYYHYPVGYVDDNYAYLGARVSIRGATGSRGATWYAGTAITGTSTTATIFSGSGVSSAIVGDHYLNTDTQNVYVCKKAGNASTATWSFEQNIKGENGTPGTNGTNGKTAYFHVKYSNDGGATFTANSGETAGAYIGTYTDNTEADSTSVSAYTWVKIEGEDGVSPTLTTSKTNGVTTITITDASGTKTATVNDGAAGARGATWYAGTAITGTSTTASVFSGSGITAAIVGDHYLNTSTQNVYVCKKAGNASTATWAYEQNIKGATGTPGTNGTNGTNGKTAYFHVKYSNDGGATFTANSGETAGSYIGTYTDNTAADSTSVSAYTWVKIEGEDGVSPTLTTSKTNGVTTITITDASGTKTATVNDGTAGARGATWYAGTTITGTSTTAAVFSGSGIASAIVGDHYLNTSTQNVYVCKKAGNASTATWAYEQNIKGAQGTPGTNGTNGKTAYFHVKYSNDGGATFTANSGETAGSYIGTYTDNNATDSTSVSAYTWVKIEGEDGVSPTLTTSKSNGVTTVTITDASGTKTATINDGATGARGATWYAGTTITGTSTTATVFSGSGITSAIVGDHYLNTSTQNVYVCKKAGNASTATWSYEQNIKGAQGTPGTNGTNGKTAYFHVKYSNDGGTTFTGNSGEDAGAYIGTYTDNTAADSTSVSAYTWVKIEGTDGKNGTNAIGLAWRVNSASYTDTGNNGECYFHGYDSDNEPADVDGWVMWNGEKLTITKGMWINHNGKVATYTPILHVYRTNVEPCHADVWWDKNLKKWRGFMYTTGNVPGTVGDWTWDETNDAILATYLLNGTAAEASISSAQLFNPPKKYSELPDYENLVVVEDLGVNLSPYFARSPYTYDNPYWNCIYSDNSSLYQIEEVGDGWMHVYCHNTTSSTIRHDYGPVASNEIEEGADYTFLVEVRNNHSTGTASGTDIYLVQTNNCQFWGGGIKENIEGDGATGSSFSPITHVPLDSSTPYIKRFVKTSEATGSTHWTLNKPSGLAVFTTRCAKNTTIDYEIRISVYKGRYTGPFRPYVDASVRNLADNANSKIDNLQVGGRNLLLGSNDTSKWGRYTPDQYQIANINTSIALVTGQEYTLTIWGTRPTRSDKTETYYQAYYSGGSIMLGRTSIDADKGYGSVTFTMPEYSTTNHYLALYNTPTTGTSGTIYGASIERIKLEVGNHGTDWTAAPEDFESGIASAQTTATNAQTAAGNAQTTADTAKDLAESVQPELIVGTHGTSATATWTGTSTVLKEIKAGTRIQYKLSSAGKSNVTLNLTLVGGTTTGAKAVYYSNTTRLGTQYGVNAVIDLVYDGSYWRILNPYTNSNNYDRILYSQAVKAATAYVGTHILCGTSAGYSNIGANVQFELSYPLLWYATADTTTISAGSTATNHYLTYPNINFSVNGTIQSGAAYKQLYLKGTMTGGKFKIAASNYLTTVEPTSADGLYYIPLGVMSSATNGRFVSTDKLYAYLNGAFQCVEYASKELADEAAKTATNFMYFDETNGLIISQEGEINSSHPVTALQDGNVRIDSASVDIYNGQKKVASYGEEVVIGDEDKSHINLDYHSLQLVDKDGDTYFHVSDLRDQTGVAELVENFTVQTQKVNGVVQNIIPFQLSQTALAITSVTIRNDTNGVKTVGTSNYTIYDTEQMTNWGKYYPTWIKLNYDRITSFGYPEDGDIISITYTTTGNTIALTLGSRATENESITWSDVDTSRVGPNSAVLGQNGIASGANSISIGDNSCAVSDDAVALGIRSIAHGKGAVAIGNNVISDGDGATSIGRYNVNNSKHIFSVGNGTNNSDRNSTFYIQNDGIVITDQKVFSYYKNNDAGLWSDKGSDRNNLWFIRYTGTAPWENSQYYSASKQSYLEYVYSAAAYNPIDGIVSSGVVNGGPSSPATETRSLELMRGAIYELYTYEYNVEKASNPYAYRGSHSYLITSPPATKYNTTGSFVPNINAMSSSANTGVTVAAGSVEFTLATPGPGGTTNYVTIKIPGVKITNSSTAYRVKYVLKRVSSPMTDQNQDAIERAYWLAQQT